MNKGEILGMSPMPGRFSNYYEDLTTLLVWNPALVITLTTLDELKDFNAHNLGDDLSQAGIQWIHLPIEDYGTPDSSDDMASILAIKQALHVLEGKKKVLVHCKGGCGRSGMLALKIMLSSKNAGTVDEELTRLRTVRPCAIETEEQLEWATATASAAE